MSGLQEQNVPSCNLKVLKDFVAEQKDVLLIVEKTGCPVCEQLDREVLPKFMAEKNQIAIAQVTIKEGDPECHKIVGDLGLKTVPAIIIFKNGLEMERQNVGGHPGTDLKVLESMAQKVKSGRPVPSNGESANPPLAATQ